MSIDRPCRHLRSSSAAAICSGVCSPRPPPGLRRRGLLPPRRAARRSRGGAARGRRRPPALRLRGPAHTARHSMTPVNVAGSTSPRPRARHRPAPPARAASAAPAAPAPAGLEIRLRARPRIDRTAHQFDGAEAGLDDVAKRRLRALVRHAAIAVGDRADLHAAEHRVRLGLQDAAEAPTTAGSSRPGPRPESCRA